MLPEDLPFVFDYTRRGAKCAEGRLEGAGIGLSPAAKFLVEQHHGTIAVESQPGKGSTFTLRPAADIARKLTRFLSLRGRVPERTGDREQTEQRHTILVVLLTPLRIDSYNPFNHSCWSGAVMAATVSGAAKKIVKWSDPSDGVPSS